MVKPSESGTLAERVRPGEHVEPDDVFAAIAAVHEEVKAAYSVVATLADGALVAFRDPYGIKPICFGEKISFVFIEFELSFI